MFYGKKANTYQSIENKHIETNQISPLARVNNPQVLKDFPEVVPIYIVCKIQKSKDLEAIKWLEKIENKNGFVFFKRKSGTPQMRY